LSLSFFGYSVFETIMPTGTIRRRIAPYVLLFAFALALRIGLVASTIGFSAPPDAEANPDQAEYEVLAFNVIRGEGFSIIPGQPTAVRPPGTSFVLVPIYAVFGRNFAAARLWFCLLSALCIPIVGIVGERVWSPRVGRFAALWLALYPGHAYYALHFLSETPATLVTSLALLIQIATLRRNPNWLDFALGLVLGLSVLIRPALAIMSTVMALGLLASSAVSLRDRILKTFVVAAAGALIVLPWLARNQRVFGRPVIATIVGGHTYWGANNAVVDNDPNLIGYWVPTSILVDAEHPLTGSELERGDLAWRYGRQYRNANLDKLPRVIFNRLGRVLFAYRETTNIILDIGLRTAWLVSLPFVLLGFFVVFRHEAVKGLVLVAPVIAVLFVAVFFYGSSRFRDGASPAHAVLAAGGFEFFLAWCATILPAMRTTLKCCTRCCKNQSLSACISGSKAETVYNK
jgi:4-amino-4-deoxy-L-arabinose transferase-like glycosyltransferase